MFSPGQLDILLMVSKKIFFEVVDGTTEGITYSGKRKRRKTVLIRIGGRSISKQAFLLGIILASLQVFDAILTYIGLTLHGIHLEGNGLLAKMMHAYGLFPTLLISKSIALCLIVFLTCIAHKRRWIRPFIFMLCGAYLTLAILPWTYIISSTHAKVTAEPK